MTTHGVSILALLIILGAVLELVLGVNDTGGIVAFVLLFLGWSILISLALGKLIYEMREGSDHLDH